METVQKVVPNLWFDTEAEQAATFYVSVFEDARVLQVTRYPEGARGPAGGVMSVVWELAGQRFVGINGGPHFPQTEAVSFAVSCRDQEEADRYWHALLADGGQESQCGWLKDRFGVSWQVAPDELHALLADPDPGRARRAMEAMLTMRRIDVAAVRAAADG